MPATVVGRDAELAAVCAFLARVPEGAAAHVLVGDPGVGKTTLWNAGIHEAAERGFRVLEARAVESEMALSFSGLADLLQAALEDVYDELAAPQRRALGVALLIEDTSGPPPDQRAVAAAVLAAIQALARRQPVVVAVDDVQWVDAASAVMLSYAGRRLRKEPVGVLLARRSGAESTVTGDLRRSLPAERFAEVEVGPLDRWTLHRIVQNHLGVALPRPLLADVHEISGGNPFYALEIVAMLRRRGVSIEAGERLPVPESLRELVHGRIDALAPECRHFLLAAAALADPTIAYAEAASGVSRDAGFRPAAEADIVELDRDRIRFTHPLLAAGAYETADPVRRAQVHARLAELLEDPEARGRHLAASVSEPDASVADALEDAAAHALARGAPRAAALLLDRACELTPPAKEEDANRRAVEAAYLHYESGDSPRAEARLRELIATLPPGRQRARALMRLARVRAYASLVEASELFQQTVDEAEGDRAILAVAHEGVASCLFHQRERLAEAVEHAELAAELALELGDEALAAEALGARWDAELLLGHEAAATTARRALELQRAGEQARVLAQPRFVHAAGYLWWARDLERARAELLELLERAAELGDESSVPLVLAILSQVECELGELASAHTRTRESQIAAEQAGQTTVLAHALAQEGLVEAQRGNVDRARRAAIRALELVPETGCREAQFVASRALAELARARGDMQGAVAHLAPVVAFARREGIVEPGATSFVLDCIEALIEVGRVVEAREALAWYEGNARRLRCVAAVAACMRCRGLLAASERKFDDALVAYGDALGVDAKDQIPLDRGRTLLALGIAQRRAKRRREARATLEEALAVFEGIGAALWAERARGELSRISGRAPTPGALTPAEERVAALVAEGKTNREVAAALFLSERTVEGHLSRIFGKLGVKYRTELAHALALRQTQGVGPPNTGGSHVSAEPVAP